MALAQATPTGDTITTWTLLWGEPQMHKGKRTLPPSSMAACSCLPFSKRQGLFVNLMKATDPLSLQKKCSGAGTVATAYSHPHTSSGPQAQLGLPG